MLPKLRQPAKVDKFPGLHGYPSHFGIELEVTEDQCKSVINRIKFLLNCLPLEFTTPVLNLLGYFSHINGSIEESHDYFRAVLRYDCTNVVATSDMAYSAFIDNRLEDSKELESRIAKWLGSSYKNRYISRSHVDISFFYFFVGLTCASMYHCSTAIKMNPSCDVARFYYTLFSYLSDRDMSFELQFHLSSLTYVLVKKPGCPILSYLKWIIETKAALVPRYKTHIMEDKLLGASKGTSCPVILLYLAQELFNNGSYHLAVEVVERSLCEERSAVGFYLLARSLKKIYDIEMEAVVVTEEDSIASLKGSRAVQVIVETQHESKHQSSAIVMSVRSMDQKSIMSVRSKSQRSTMSKNITSLRESEEISDLDSDDSPLDPKLVEIFDAIRCSCLIETYNVSHILMLSEMFILCRHVNEAVLYLHDVINRGSDIQKCHGYLKLATCYIELKKLEFSSSYLKKYSESGEFEVTDEYMNLVVKLADNFIKTKQALLAKEWLIVMEQHHHPSCGQFTMRLKRLISKDKGLLDTVFSTDKPKQKKMSRRKLGSSGSIIT